MVYEPYELRSRWRVPWRVARVTRVTRNHLGHHGTRAQQAFGCSSHGTSQGRMFRSFTELGKWIGFRLSMWIWEPVDWRFSWYLNFIGDMLVFHRGIMGYSMGNPSKLSKPDGKIKRNRRWKRASWENPIMNMVKSWEHMGYPLVI